MPPARCNDARAVAAQPQRPAYSSPQQVSPELTMASKRLRTIDVLDRYHSELVQEWSKELTASVLAQAAPVARKRRS